MLGHAHLLKREHDLALEMSESAVEERPSCPATFSMRANILNYCGESQAAVAPALQALRLSPVAQTLYPEVLAVAYYLSGRLDEALQAANETLTLAPDSVDSRAIIAAALAETGRRDAARLAGREILEIDAGFDLTIFAESHPFRDDDVLDRLVGALRLSGLEEEQTAARVHGFSARSRRRVAPQPRR